jgi:hypothetical protein
MKSKAKYLLILFLAVSGFSPRAFALFGVGDIVFDPSNYAEIIQLYNEGRQQVDSLSGILGINTQQLTTMNGVLSSMGTAGNLTNFPTGISQNQLLSLVQGQLGVQGMDLSSIGKFLNPTGVFDVFLGQPTSQWQQMVSSPLGYFGSTLRSDATTRIGGNIGQTPPEIAYTQWVGAMTPSEVSANSTGITLTASQLLLNDYYQDAQTRHNTLSAFDAKISTDKANGGQATTVNQLLASENAQSQTSNELLLNLTKEQQRHQEILLSNQAAQTDLLRDQAKREELAREMGALDNSGGP